MVKKAKFFKIFKQWFIRQDEYWEKCLAIDGKIMHLKEPLEYLDGLVGSASAYQSRDATLNPGHVTSMG